MHPSAPHPGQRGQRRRRCRHRKGLDPNGADRAGRRAGLLGMAAKHGMHSNAANPTHLNQPCPQAAPTATTHHPPAAAIGRAKHRLARAWRKH
mmetsp:Transcript_18924/g.52440  ORF Transcript_18924/g.52440 Transcript_18924/m.52440 type:complete len:93 (+) Transcript_18924:120-398(+)